MKRDRTVGWTSVLTLLCAACSAQITDGEVASRGSEVQWQYLGDGYYDVALAVPDALGAAVRAEATVLTYDDVSASDGTPIRGTCGITFISPRYAITAAHCVDQDPGPFDVEVQTYALSESVPWQQAKNLSGSFPGFTHPVMTVGDGYVIEKRTCTVVTRCGPEEAMGPRFNCPPGSENADVAMIRCSDAPACDTGWVDVAEQDTAGADVVMPWTHEVYSITGNPGSDLYDHYTYYDGDRTDNFHYFGDDRNQLLPLVSTPFVQMGNEIAHEKGSQDANVHFTDLIGCHGTSGSGIMQREPSGSYSLLGPVAATMSWGSPSDVLCVDKSFAGPGQDLFGYAHLAFTQAVAEDAEGDCAALTCGTGGDVQNLLMWLKCHRLRIPELQVWPWFDPWGFPWPCLSCTPWEKTRIWNEGVVRLMPGARISIPAEQYTAGQRYRFSMRVVPPAGGGASILNVRLGDDALLTGARPVFGVGERAGVVTASFSPRTTGAHTLIVEADRGSSGTLRVTEIVVWRDSAVNTFDRFDMRAGAGLISPRVGGGAPVPMRFTGDGRGGYAALLEQGERMLMTRQALIGGRSYTISFSGTTDGLLVCGLLHGDGREVATWCNVSGGRATAQLTPIAGAQPIAWFVGAPVDRATVRIDDAQLR